MNIPEGLLKKCAIGAAFFVLVLIYIHHFHNSFFYDDIYCIQQNLAIRSLKNIPSFFKDAHKFASIDAYQPYRPFFLISYAIDYSLGGLKPTVMHLHTFIGFILLCSFFFLFAKKIFDHVVTDGFYSALLATCIFAYHPATADVINYLYARTDSFAALYGMMSIVMYLYLPLAKKYHLYFIPIVVGCLFKVNAAMFIPMLWMYKVFFEDGKGFNGIIPWVKKNMKEIVPAMVVLLFSILLVMFKSVMSTTGDTSRIKSLMTQAHVMMNYFMLFFLPENLNPNGWRDYIESPMDYHFITGMLFLAVSAVVIYITSLRKSTKPISLGLLWFFAFLVPTSIFLTILVPQVDYYVFIPFMGMSLAAAGVITFVFEKLKQSSISKYAIVFTCLVILASLAYGARLRVGVWSSNEAMVEDVLKKDPTNGRMLMNYGTELMGQGKMQEAEMQIEKAKQYWPDYDLIYVNLGIIRNTYNDTVNAEANFRKAVSLNGWDHYTSCFFYGRYLYQRHKINEAIDQLSEAVKEYPSYTEAWHLLIQVYWQTHNQVIAPTCRQMLAIMPGDSLATKYLSAYSADSLHFSLPAARYDSLMEKQTEAHPTADGYINLSISYFNKGDFRKVIELCNKALKLQPNSATAYNNICAAYNNLQEWDNAIEAGQKALQLQPNMELAKNNLSFALSQKAKKK